jgi:hypothetical protein
MQRVSASLLTALSAVSFNTVFAADRPLAREVPAGSWTSACESCDKTLSNASTRGDPGLGGQAVWSRAETDDGTNYPQVTGRSDFCGFMRPSTRNTATAADAIAARDPGAW